MIEIVDLKKERQENCRAMICQLNASAFDWKKEKGLFFLQDNDKISNKIIEFLKIAAQNSVDLILFPEISIPESQIGQIQHWSKQQNAIAICGSHYYSTKEGIISRCPVIIDGVVYFTEKAAPSPFEISPIVGDGLRKGQRTVKFINTSVGNIAVLICADYLDEKLKASVELQKIDLLCVPSFQRDSEVYYRRMNAEVENAQNGIYILYSNFIDVKYGDGHSALFGALDRIFIEKLNEQKLTDSDPDKKLYQFGQETEYVIVELDINHKRPFANRNIYTKPNVRILPNNNSLNAVDLRFIQKIAHDDERYKRIDELYVPPKEFDDIINTIDEKNIVFVVGDPGIGKTYTAAKLLKHYYQHGYEPIWFSGLEKEDRDIQSKVLTDFIPTQKQIVYFEDPFGRTIFERRDSLFQVFSPLMEKLAKLNSKVIITSRKEPFESFSNESLLERDVINLKRELNVRNPSYDAQGLFAVFCKLAKIICPWYSQKEFVDLVEDAIDKGKLTTPLAIRDLVFVSRNISSINDLKICIDRREDETVKVFALEILTANLSIKVILYLIMLGGNKGKAILSGIYENVAKILNQQNFPINSFSFNIEIRTQLGYRIEQIGYLNSFYRFTHPVYEEALASLTVSDPTCEFAAKLIISEIAKMDTRHAYGLINRYVVKYPAMSILLFKNLLETSELTSDDAMLLVLARKLISTYFITKNEEYFELACHCYSLPKVVDELNNHHYSGLNDIIHKLNLVQRYLKNSPFSFDSSYAKKMNWAQIFTNDSHLFGNSAKVVVMFEICSSIDKKAVVTLISKKGVNFLKGIYFLIDKNIRERFKKILEEIGLEHDLGQYDEQLARIETSKILDRFLVVKQIIFTEYAYFGKITIDTGAERAIKKRWINLLPVGITSVEGDFEAGKIVGIFNMAGRLLAVGVIEYSAKQLKKLKGHSSQEFLELIGYYHTSSAVESKYLLRFNTGSKNDAHLWNYQLQDNDSI